MDDCDKLYVHIRSIGYQENLDGEGRKTYYSKASCNQIMDDIANLKDLMAKASLIPGCEDRLYKAEQKINNLMEMAEKKGCL